LSKKSTGKMQRPSQNRKKLKKKTFDWVKRTKKCKGLVKYEKNSKEKMKRPS
jgi:hypothetical protein